MQYLSLIAKTSMYTGSGISRVENSGTPALFIWNRRSVNAVHVRRDPECDDTSLVLPPVSRNDCVSNTHLTDICDMT